MNNHRFIIGILLMFVAAAAGSQTFDWAKRIGGTQSDNARSIAADSAGNVYTLGGFRSGVDFDPGTGVSNLIATGQSDIALSKLDASGNFLWAKQFGGPGYEYGIQVKIDADGNIYCTGYFADSVDFDPGAGTNFLKSAGSDDAFVVKLDPSGNLLWAKRIGAGNNDRGNGLAVDSSGNVYWTGMYSSTVDFDPGPGTFSLASSGGYDIFVVKLDSSGNFSWADRMGGTTADAGWSISADADEAVYFTGYFGNTADFDPGTGTFNLISAGTSDIFVCKLDTSGSLVWAKGIGGTSNDAGFTLKLNDSGHVYVGGYFYGTPDFDPGTGTFTMTSAGLEDSYILKLDTSGAFVWAVQLGGNGSDRGYGLALDNSGYVYSTGFFDSTADFDPGISVFNLTTAGTSDIFISKIDDSGNFVWAMQTGGTLVEQAYSLALDNWDNIYSTGYFTDTVDFDPGADTFDLISSGADDIFIFKLTQCTQSSAALTPTACDSYISPSGLYTWTSTGLYMDTIPGSSGCDSVFTVNLTIVTVDTSVLVSGQTLTAVDSAASYQWVNCDSNFAGIPGDTNQSFTPAINGNYAVIVTNGSCNDTSSCYSTIVNQEMSQPKPEFTIYPNPTDGVFTIQAQAESNDVSFFVTDMYGKLFGCGILDPHGKTDFRIDGPAGLYFVKLAPASGQETRKVIRN